MCAPLASFTDRMIPNQTCLIEFKTNLYVSGKKFVNFLEKNSLNIVGCALGTALLVHQWLVLGTTVTVFAGFNILSNAVASQTWIPRSVRLFIVEKGGCVVGMATALALMATQSHIIGLSLLIYSSYKFIDSMGLIPRNISLFIERYLPWRALPGCALIDSTPLGLLNLASLISNFRPVERFLYEKFDLIVHKLFRMDAPTIEEIVEPNSKPKLSYQDIIKILDAKDSDYLSYTLEPSHCSHSADSTVPLEKRDHHFEKLLKMVKPISWAQDYQKIFAHNSFLAYLREEFPDVKVDDLKKQPHFYANKLATAAKLTSSAFAQQWMENRFKGVVDILNGELACRVKGSQSELNAAINDLSKVVPYLEEINQDSHKSDEVNSILFRLALHTSSNKSSEIKAIASKILQEVTQKTYNQLPNTPSNLAKRYEFKVRTILEDERLKTIQSLAKNTESDLTIIWNAIFPPAKDEIKANKDVSPEIIEIEDSFLVSLHRYYLSFGFLPMSKYDRENSTTPLHYVAKICNRLFNFTLDKKPAESAFETYRNKLETDLISCKNNEFWSYIEHVLESNNLSTDEINSIRNRYHTYFFWPDSVTQQNFRRLLLVSLGVLKKF